MSTKKAEFDSTSLDELWSLHERISSILSARINAEKGELEKRLAILNGGIGRAGDLLSPGKRPRRRYPAVLPKYRDPQTSETWSGRGKRPRWLVAAVKAGHRIEEFEINAGGRTKGRQRV